jgi:hypothetical protein
MGTSICSAGKVVGLGIWQQTVLCLQRAGHVLWFMVCWNFCIPVAKWPSPQAALDTLIAPFTWSVMAKHMLIADVIQLQS